MQGGLTIFKRYTAANLQKKIDQYFDEKKKNKEAASLTGLALHLKCTRSNLVDYGKTDEFYEIIQQAKLRCENILEEKMIAGTPPTGIIFILKNNYGWNDKVQVDQTIKGTISLASLFDQAARQKQIQGSKQEIIEGEIIETQTEESIFDEKESNNLINEELPSELF